MFSKNNIASQQRELLEFPLLPNTYSPDVRRSSSELEIHNGNQKNTEGDGDNKDVNTEIETFSNVVKKSTEGKITKPSATIIENQFGMNGLLSCIRATEINPNLVTLAMGVDLDELGLNMNTQKTLYNTFSGPFSDRPCRVQDCDYHVPSEYLVNIFIRDRLPAFNLANLKDEEIFFLFYGSVGDSIQLESAVELYNRNWRYHLDEKVWISLVPGFRNYRKIGNIEKGTFYYFDARIWRRVAKEFEFDANKLEKCPNLNRTE